MEKRPVAADPILTPVVRRRVVVVDAHPVLTRCAGPLFADRAALGSARDLARAYDRAVGLPHVPFAEPEVELPKFRRRTCWLSRGGRLRGRDGVQRSECD